MRTLTALLISMCFILAGCSSVSVQDYAGNKPALDPTAFFNGDLVAQGVVKDRGGKVIRHFTADIKAYWENGVGTLEEDFLFDDGEEDRRVWTLRPHPGGGYIGTAGDVVGEGRARIAGNAMFLDYVLQVPWREDSIDLRIDDRMYLVSPDVLINESIMSKFGVQVGALLLTIRKLPPSPAIGQ